MRTALLIATLAALAAGVWWFSRPSADSDVLTLPEREAAAARARTAASTPSEPAPTAPRRIEREPGATLRGVVIDATGEPQAAVTLGLVDHDGKLLDEVTTDAEGRYELLDDNLLGAAVQIHLPEDPALDATIRTLEPQLRARELRVLDLVVGPTRVVRGFVLDMDGEPLSGVAIRLSGLDLTGAAAPDDTHAEHAWTTTTQRGGGFVFPYAPPSALRVEAIGADLGSDSAFVAPGRFEAVVDLVLEPTARLTVLSSRAGVRVRVSCHEEGCFGGDNGWREPLPAASAQDGEGSDGIAAREREKIRVFTLDMMNRFYPEVVPPDAATLSLEVLQESFSQRLSMLSQDQLLKIAERIQQDDLQAWVREHMPQPSEPTPPPLRWSIVAEGSAGQSFEVPADFAYTVELLDPKGGVTACGVVRPGPGDDLDVPCGDKARSVVVGRAVGLDRKARPTLLVHLENQEPQASKATATTGPDGRFRFELELDHTVPAALTAEGLFGGRRALALIPGATLDLGDVAFGAPAERPDLWPGQSFGGTGGLMTLTDGGVRVHEVEDDSPLALAGIEAGDRIVRIDADPAATMLIEEVFQRLRGDPGTTVDVRIRSKLGELYDVTIERAMVKAPGEVFLHYGEGPYPADFDF